MKHTHLLPSPQFINLIIDQFTLSLLTRREKQEVLFQFQKLFKFLLVKILLFKHKKLHYFVWKSNYRQEV